MTDALNAAIEELKTQLAESIEAIKEDPKMAEVLKLHSALNTMEELVGASPTSLASAFALEPATAVQPGEFYGLEALKAAKQYLKKRGKPASTDEIVSAIRAGGAIVPSIERLRVSLSRSTLDIAKVGTDHYGLLEFYPDVMQRRKKGKGSTGVEAVQSQEILSPNEEDDPSVLKLVENDIQDLIDEADKHEAAKQTVG
jgi:hypothetical protein